MILGWDPDALPAGWQAVQQRYYALNWIRAAVTWVAFGVFLAALVILAGGVRRPSCNPATDLTQTISRTGGGGLRSATAIPHLGSV